MQGHVNNYILILPSYPFRLSSPPGIDRQMREYGDKELGRKLIFEILFLTT
jgi:hypothetical protein